MKINVDHRVAVVDGGVFKTLLVKNNPHEVSEKLGDTLITEGKAVLENEIGILAFSGSTDVNLHSLKVTDLRLIANNLGIDGANAMNKMALIEAILSSSGGQQ